MGDPLASFWPGGSFDFRWQLINDPSVPTTKVSSEEAYQALRWGLHYTQQKLREERELRKQLERKKQPASAEASLDPSANSA